MTLSLLVFSSVLAEEVKKQEQAAQTTQLQPVIRPKRNPDEWQGGGGGYGPSGGAGGGFGGGDSFSSG